MAVVRVELVVGSLVADVVVCLSLPELLTATERLIDNKVTEVITHAMINNVFVFIVPVLISVKMLPMLCQPEIRDLLKIVRYTGIKIGYKQASKNINHGKIF